MTPRRFDSSGLYRMAALTILAILASGLAVEPALAQTSGSTSPQPVAEQIGTALNQAPVVSGVNLSATVTLTGQPGQRVCVRGIYIKATGAAVTTAVTIQDGATTVLDLGTLAIPLTGPATAFTGTPLLCGSPGNTVTVTIGAGGALAVTTTSVIADRL